MHVFPTKAAEFEKIAKPQWAKMLAGQLLSPETMARLKTVVPAGKTRQVGRTMLGAGSEGKVYTSFTGGIGPTVLKKYHKLVKAPATATRQIPKWLQNQAEGMNAFPDVFAKVHGVNPVGLTVEKLVPDPVHNTSPAAVGNLIDSARKYWGGDYRVIGALRRAETAAGKKMYASPQKVLMRQQQDSPHVFEVRDAFSNSSNIMFRPDSGAAVISDPMIEKYKNPLFARLAQLRQARNQAQDVTATTTDNRFIWSLPGLMTKLRQNFPTFGLLSNKQAALIPELQLQEHQQRIQDRTVDDSPRMLVYHGLGSGKSLSAIAAAEAAKQLSGGNYGVAVPASLRGNFAKEINKFTRGSNPEIMSYTGLALGKEFQDPPETLIMDEAHRLRNPASASSRAAARAAAKAQRLLLLTGSPITNSPADMANLLALLHNKKITPEEFEKRYIGYKKVRPGLFNWLRGIKPGEKPVVKNEKELRKLLAGKVDYQPSRTPEGVNVNEEVVRVPLSPAQDKIQKAIRTKIPPGFLWKLDKEFPLSRDELAKLNSFMTGLRQVSLSTQPFRADKDPVKAFEQSAKLQEAFKRLQQELGADPRKKAIIYSNFVDSGLGPYAAGLEKAKIPHAFFHGGVSAKARQAAVDAYNQGKLRALLIGPAGAEGLSTKGTSLIQLLDPHWHESRSQQAKGRGLRFDSHRDLPDELKNVAVQRYLSASKDPSFLGRLLGYKRERTGDEVLERLTAEKERVNEEFRRLLKEEGSRHKQDEDEDPEKQSAAPEFHPDYTPGQLHRMGVYKSLYEKDGPRLASQGEWKPEWVTEHDPKGWLEWYQNYNAGRRIPDEDLRQIKRWANFKSRHGGPFMANPTARRGWALRNWAINPEKLVPERAEEVRTMLEDYQAQELKKYLKRRFGQGEKQADDALSDDALSVAKLLKPALKAYVDRRLPTDLAFINTAKALKWRERKKKETPTPSPSILD